MTRDNSRLMSTEPTKAYLVKFRIVNNMEAIVHAHSLADARRRFDAGEGNHTIENTYQDDRLPGCKIKRLPDEDRAR